MCGECLQCLSHTGFAPTHSVHAFLVYTAQAPSCSAGELSKVGPGLCALPRSKLLRFRFLGTPQMHRLGWACVLCPSQVREAQVTRCLVSTLSTDGQCILSPPLSQLLGFLGAQQEHRLRCAMCLLWGADLWVRPSRQMSTIQDPRKTWLATGSLLTFWWRMPVSVTKIAAAPCLPALAVAHLPLCLRREGGACLVFTQSFVV